MNKQYLLNLSIDLITIVFLWLVIFDWISLAHPGMQVVIKGIFLFGMLCWMLIRARSGRPFNIPRIVVPLAIYFLFQILSTTRSPLPFHALEMNLGNIFIFVAFIFIIDSLDGQWESYRWENALIGVAVLFSIFNLMVTANWFQTWWNINGSLFAPTPYGFRLPGVFLLHPNNEVAFINLILPIALARFLRTPSKMKRLLWICVLILILVIEYFTSSRGGWIAAIAAIITTIGLIFSPNMSNWFNRRSFKLRFSQVSLRRVLVLVILFIITLAVAFLFLQQVTSTEHVPIASARSAIFRTAWNIFARSPILGNGKGSMHVLPVVEDQLPPGFYLVHAHNLLLEIGAEAGIIGLILVILSIILFIQTFFQAWHDTLKERRYSLAAYGGAIVGFAVHHQVDVPMEAPFTLISFLIIIALVCKLSPQQGKMRIESRRGLFVLVCLTLVYLIGSSYVFRGSQEYFQGIEAANQKRWEEASKLICQASVENPELTLYSFQCGQSKAFAYQQSGEEQGLNEAISSLEKGLSKDPYWPVHWANLAMLEWEGGEESQAIHHMRQALEAAPRNPSFALNLGWMEEQLGHENEAISAYRHAFQLDPWMTRTLFSFATSLRKTIAEEQASYVYDTSALWKGLVALDEGNPEDARSHLERAIIFEPRNPRAYASLALAYQLLGDTEQAWKNVQIAIFVDNSSPYALHLAGRIAYQQGRESDAIGYFDRSFSLIQSKSYSEDYYGGVYRRAYLATDLVPQFRRADLTPEMAEDFHILAEHWAQNGDDEKAEEILDFISREMN